MSPGEIAWRLGCASRDLIDHVRMPMISAPALARGLLERGDRPLGGGFAVLPAGFGEFFAGITVSSELRRRADDAVGGYVELFDLSRQFIGQPPDWNRDHKHGIQRRSPSRVSSVAKLPCELDLR